MKSILSFITGCLCLFTLGSCSDSQRNAADGAPYHLTGTLWQDSTTVDSIVTLIVDRHGLSFDAKGDSIPAFQQIELPVVDGHFVYKGNAPLDVDELYVYDQHGHLGHLYATSGADLEIRFYKDGTILHKGMDTTALIKAVLFRDSIPLIKDSLYVRRTLGSMPESAKPAWLLRSIDQMLDQKSLALNRNSRLPRVSIQTPDTIFPLLGSRTESLLLLFWAAEDAASVDSLQMFTSVASDYGLHRYAESFASNKSATRRPLARRIALCSVCLNTPDSATWRSAISGLPGMHTILPGGFAHPLAASCRVDRVPSLVLVDRFGNYQIANVWGNELYTWLDKAPLNSSLNSKLKKK